MFASSVTNRARKTNCECSKISVCSLHRVERERERELKFFHFVIIVLRVVVGKLCVASISRDAYFQQSNFKVILLAREGD